jgi:hypothetical protein
VAKIVHKEKTCFIKHRSILNDLISTWEGLEWVEGTRQKDFLLNIDFDKMYDRIEWDFIFNMLHSLGFDSLYHRSMDMLFSWDYTRVNAKGVLLESITLQCSIQQGSSLAPYLYVIAVDALGYLLEVARV